MNYIVLLLLLSSLTITGFAADKDKSDAKALPAESPAPAKQESVRMRFVPGSVPMKGEAAFEGACWSALGTGPVKGVLSLWARADIGSKFPVQDAAGVTLFEVLLVKGNDSHVVLEVQSKQGSRRFDLARDEVGVVKVAGVKYELLYPSTYVAAARNEKPTTPKASIWVTRRL